MAKEQQSSAELAKNETENEDAFESPEVGTLLPAEPEVSPAFEIRGDGSKAYFSTESAAAAPVRERGF